MMHNPLLLFLCSLRAYREHPYDLSEYWASTGLTGDEIGQRYLRGAEDYLVKDYVQRLDHYEDVRLSAGRVIILYGFNPSNAEATFMQNTSTQRFSKKHLNLVRLVFIG